MDDPSFWATKVKTHVLPLPTAAQVVGV